MRAAIALSLLALAGCAVPTTGVIPRADDMYTVTRQGAAAFVPLSSVTAEAVKEAAAYCDKAGRRYKQIHMKEIQAGLGRYPETELLFRCD